MGKNSVKPSKGRKSTGLEEGNLSESSIANKSPPPSHTTPMRYSTGISPVVQNNLPDMDQLKLCVKVPWPGPSAEVPYQEFKAKVTRSLKIFKLEGFAANLYLLRCLDDPILSKVEEMMAEDLSIDEIWENLDKKYNAAWRKIALRNNWQNLRQKQGETPTEFSHRVETQARLMKVAANRHITDEDIAAKFRDSLREELQEKLETFFGPEYAELEETREAAEYFESKMRARNIHRPNQKSDNKKILCRAIAAGKTCRFGTQCRFSHDKRSASSPSTETGPNESARFSSSSGVNNAKSAGGKDQDAKPSTVCYRFIATGDCSRGDQCPYPHQLPNNKSTTNVAKTQPTTAAIECSTKLDSCGAILHNNDCKPLTAEICVAEGDGLPSISVKALIDTGSTVNLCSLSWAKSNLSVPIETDPNSFNSICPIKLADGTSTLQPTARINLLCSTLRAKCHQDFLVVDSLSPAYDIILGLPALSSLGLHICFTTDDPWPVLTSGHGHERYAEDNLNDNYVKSDPSGDPAELSSLDGLMPSSCGITFEPAPTITNIVEASSMDAPIIFADPMPLSKIIDDSDSNKFYYLLDDLPWSTNRRPFNNRREVEARFRSLEKSLSQDQHIQVQDSFWELIDSGAIELCDPSFVKSYIPLNPVFRDASVSATTPCRLTVDARRLNEFIATGSCEGATPITSNLTQWRLAPHYVSLDLSKAYYSIRISDAASEYCGGYMYGLTFRWRRLPFGLRCSSACLHQALYPLLKPFHKECCLHQYVDDIGLSNISISTLVHNEAIISKILDNAGFTLQHRKRIASNESEGVFKQFGYQWILCQDEAGPCDHILYKLPSELSDGKIPTTRRELSSAYGRWYDPIGILPAVATCARINLREAFLQSPGWDDSIDQKHIKAFQSWRNNISEGPHITIPRALNPLELYMYCDSSTIAWACVALAPAYIDSADNLQENAILVPLRGTGSVYGASMESWSIPKKELYCLFRACELLVELSSAVDEAYPQTKGKRQWCIFSDSAIAIYRLKANHSKCQLTPLEKRWLEYVQQACTQGKWRVVHIASPKNLADAPSRGILPITPFSTTLAEARQSAAESPVVEYQPQEQPLNNPETTAIVAAIIEECSDEQPDQRQSLLPVDYDAIKQHQESDPILKEIRQWHQRGQRWSIHFNLPRSFLEKEAPLYEINSEDGLLYRVTLTNTQGEVLPRIAIASGDNGDSPFNITNIIDAAHNKFLHLGYPKLADIIEATYYSRNLRALVRRRLSTCDACQRANAHIKHKKKFGRVRFKGTAPGQVLAVDHMSMTDGRSISHPGKAFKAIISITCGVTGFTWLRTVFSLTVAELIYHLQTLFGDYGAPRVLVFDGYAVNTPWTDNKQSQQLKWWASGLGILLVTIPPQGGPYAGWYERKHQFVRQALRVSTLTGSAIDNWPAEIPYIQLALNAAPYGKGSDLSPLQLFYSNCGRLPTEPVGNDDKAILDGIRHLVNPVEQSFLQQLHQDNATSFRLMFRDYCEHWSKIKEAQQAAHQRRHGARHSKDVMVGDLALVYRPSGHRMIPNFVGPYEVKEILSDSTCRLDIPDEGKRNISEIQLLANVVPYRVRDESSDVMSWIQCSKCLAWHEVSELLFNRFRHEKARFVCSYVKKRCGRPQDADA